MIKLSEPPRSKRFITNINAAILPFEISTNFAAASAVPPVAIMRVASPLESSGLSSGCCGEEFFLLLYILSELEAKKELGRNDWQMGRHSLLSSRYIVLEDEVIHLTDIRIYAFNQLDLIDIFLFDLEGLKIVDHRNIGNTVFDNDKGILLN